MLHNVMYAVYRSDIRNVSVARALQPSSPKAVGDKDNNSMVNRRVGWLGGSNNHIASTWL